MSKYSNKNLRDSSLRGNISSDDDENELFPSSSAPINYTGSVSSKSLTQAKQPRRRSRSTSKYSNRNLRDSSLPGNISSDDDDNDFAPSSSAPIQYSGSLSSKSLTQQKKPRSRSLSKFSKRNPRGDTSSDDGDNDVNSRSSEPVKAAESVSSKSLMSQKKPRSRSLSKYSNRNLRESLRGNNCSDDDDNISRSSAPVTTSSTDSSAKRSFRKPKRLPSLTKYSYRVSTDCDDDDDNSQPSLPLRVPGSDDENDEGKTSNLSSDDDESDDIISLGSDTKTDSDDSSSEEEKEEERRPSVVRRWRPPAVDNSALPPAFRLSAGSNHSGKLSSSNHSGKYSTSNHSHKSSEGTKVLKKGRKPAPRPKPLPSSKTTSEEEKESRTEEQNTTSSDDNEEEYVRQTTRKRGKSKTRESEKSAPPAKQNQEQFQQNMAELKQIINQGNTSRPSEYLTSADGAFAATRRKREQPKKKNLGSSVTAAPRSTDWLGSGMPKKRSWKVKGVKSIS